MCHSVDRRSDEVAAGCGVLLSLGPHLAALLSQAEIL